MGGSQAVKVLTQLVSVVALSRLLTPDDFGVAASVSPILAFMLIFQDLGLQQAIIQRASISQQDLSRIFWVNLLLGATMTLLMVALSPAAAWFFGDPRLLLVTAVAAAPLLFYAVSVVPSALLSRNGQFGLLAANDVLTAVLALAAAVTGALLGLRYWSLILGGTVAGAASAAALLIEARWLPARPGWGWPDRDIMHFGKNMTGSTLVNFFARNADNLLIGHAWGIIPLGTYDRAYKLLLLPLQTISYPVYRVMVPMLSRVQRDKPWFRTVYLRAASQVALVTVPGVAALVATADTVIPLVFGPHWLNVTPIYVWLGLAGLIQPVGSTLGWIFISQARTRSMFWLSLYIAATTVGSFLVGLPYGAVGVAAAFAISEYVLRLPVQYWWVARVGPVTAGDLILLQGPLLLAAGTTWLIAIRLLAPGLHLSGLALIAATVALSYGLALLAMAATGTGRSTLKDSASMAWQVARPALARA